MTVLGEVSTVFAAKALGRFARVPLGSGLQTSLYPVALLWDSLRVSDINRMLLECSQVPLQIFIVFSLNVHGS